MASPDPISTARALADKPQEAPLEQALQRPYQHGFVTDIESDSLPPGLDEDTIRAISRKKKEPAFLLDWRLAALKRWQAMALPDWARLNIAPIDFQALSYYSAPKSMKDAPKSLDEVDPKLLETYEKLGVPLHERAALAGVAVDAVFDSVSVGTTFRQQLADVGVIFCSFSHAVQEHPALVERYLGTVVPQGDNFYAALNSAVFSDGSFVYIPKGVKCPMELSSYFRINAQNTGQFERTLIIAEEGSQVSYLEGCTAPQRDENQLHAAVVELIAHDDAFIKYSTVQNWYPGDEHGKGGIYNFVTKRGLAAGKRSRIAWTQIETGSAITWKYPSCVLRGEGSSGEFFSIAVSNHRQQADTGTKMIHLGKNTTSRLVSKGISAGHAHNAGGRGRAQPHAVRFAADRPALRRPHLPLRGHGTQRCRGRARGHHHPHLRRAPVLLRAAGHRPAGSHGADRRRLLPGGAGGAADGVRARGQGAAGGVAGRRGGLSHS